MGWRPDSVELREGGDSPALVLLWSQDGERGHGFDVGPGPGP